MTSRKAPGPCDQAAPGLGRSMPLALVAVLTILLSISAGSCFPSKPFYPDEDNDMILANEDCDDSDPEVGRYAYLDADGDTYGDNRESVADCGPPEGYALRSGDCRDDVATVYPGAAESCDDYDDQNCDGVPDNGEAQPRDWYVDGDQDGYGWFAVRETSCLAPVGYVSTSTDCNDGDPAVYPGAEEIPCNGINEDCDSEDDDNPDDDGDLYDSCDPAPTPNDCLSPPTEKSMEDCEPADCNDHDPGVHPNAPELCFDSTDSNCDGLSFPCALDLATRTESRVLRLNGDQSEQLGNALVLLSTMIGTGVESLAAGASHAHDGAGSVHVVQVDCCSTRHSDGAPCICTDSATSEMNIADVATTIEGDTGNQAGYCLQFGDINLDDEADLIIGSPGATDDATHGTVYIALGPISGEQRLNLEVTPNITESTSGTGFGQVVVLLDPLGTEWQVILSIGSPSYSTDDPADGAIGAVSFYGIAQFYTEKELESDLVATLYGPYRSGHFGIALAAVPNASEPTLLIGSDRYGMDLSMQGAVFLVPDPIREDALDDAAVCVGDTNQYLGGALAVGEHLTSSGASVALISSQSPPGVYLVPLSNLDTPGEYPVEDVATYFVRLPDYDLIPTTPGLYAADVNTDGSDDILLGAPWADTDAGALYIFLGPFADKTDPLIRLETDDADATILGRPDDGLGNAITVGDIDHDGYQDLVVGASQADNHAGAVYVIFGALDSLSGLGATDDSLSRLGPIDNSSSRLGATSVTKKTDRKAAGVGGTATRVNAPRSEIRSPDMRMTDPATGETRQTLQKAPFGSEWPYPGPGTPHRKPETRSPAPEQSH